MKKSKKQWLKEKSIRFDPKKLAKAKKTGVIKLLPDRCRAALDDLLIDKSV